LLQGGCSAAPRQLNDRGLDQKSVWAGQSVGKSRYRVRKKEKL
jgi:hypothetical protein